jgi:hypothetical protein
MPSKLVEACFVPVAPVMLAPFWTDSGSHGFAIISGFGTGLIGFGAICKLTALFWCCGFGTGLLDFRGSCGIETPKMWAQPDNVLDTSQVSADAGLTNPTRTIKHNMFFNIIFYPYSKFSENKLSKIHLAFNFYNFKNTITDV